MPTVRYSLAPAVFAAFLLGGSACESEGGSRDGADASAASGGQPGMASGGANGTGSGGRSSTGGASSPGTGGAGSASGGAGGRSPTGSGGAATGGRASGGISGSGGTPTTGGNGGSGTAATPLDCGTIGWAVENHGPPVNRVNYVIIGDGYATADLGAGGVFEQHINKAMAKRFSVPIGEVYSRYRNFVNICAIKLVSANKICNGSTLGCCGDDTSRLATCTASAVNNALSANLPASFMMDWKAVVLNGSSWWNTGSALMLWSGGHADAAGAALHEGGHGFHQLADEYGDCTGATCGSNTMGTGASGTEYGEVNSTGNAMTTGGKWDLWLGYTQVGATGLQGTWSGSRYVGTGQYRPSANSMMNSLFGSNVNTSFNAVSREQMIFNIWRAVRPVDATMPAAGAVANPNTLEVKVIDPAVIRVDWSVDGAVVAAAGGEKFDVKARALASGSHTITARAYDNAGEDLVRYRTGKCPTSVTGSTCSRTAWPNSQQTVTWTVTIP